RNQELEQPPRYGSHLNRRPESRIKSIGWPPSIEQSPSTLRDTPRNLWVTRSEHEHEHEHEGIGHEASRRMKLMRGAAGADLRRGQPAGAPDLARHRP
ncbi:MAG: hypothetical protein V2A73_00285, partial [Pseudomonadota bacterium]